MGARMAEEIMAKLEYVQSITNFHDLSIDLIDVSKLLYLLCYYS